jgi:hypothetical protein
MTAEMIDGRAIARDLKDDVAREVGGEQCPRCVDMPTVGRVGGRPHWVLHLWC